MVVYLNQKASMLCCLLIFILELFYLCTRSSYSSVIQFVYNEEDFFFDYFDNINYKCFVIM